MILVTGATGRTGREVVRLLAAEGRPVRAYVRDLAKARPLERPGVEFALGDLGDAEALAAALRGVRSAALILSNGPRQLELERGFVDAAARAGVAHVVKLSSMEALPGATNPVHRAHYESERHLAAAGPAWTMIRTSFYLQNLLPLAARVRTDGVLSLPVGEGTATMTDTADAAAAIAAVLTGDGHGGGRYDVTGPERLSFHEVAARLARLTGRPVRYVPEDPVAYRARLAQVIPSPWHVDAVCDIFREIAEGYYVEPTEDFRRLTGRAPISLDDFVRAHGAAFGMEAGA